MKNSLESTETETADASNAIDVLGGTPLVSEEVQSVGPDGALRTAVVSVKTRATPEKYPPARRNAEQTTTLRLPS